MRSRSRIPWLSVPLIAIVASLWMAPVASALVPDVDSGLNQGFVTTFFERYATGHSLSGYPGTPPTGSTVSNLNVALGNASEAVAGSYSALAQFAGVRLSVYNIGTQNMNASTSRWVRWRITSTLRNIYVQVKIPSEAATPTVTPTGGYSWDSFQLLEVRAGSQIGGSSTFPVAPSDGFYLHWGWRRNGSVGGESSMQGAACTWNAGNGVPFEADIPKPSGAIAMYSTAGGCGTSQNQRNVAYFLPATALTVTAPVDWTNQPYDITTGDGVDRSGSTLDAAIKAELRAHPERYQDFVA
jgi:hypothetical protein